MSLIVCGYATTANLSATYDNTAITPTLTFTATGTQVIDGQTVLLNDIILVKNQTSPIENGIYICTVAPILAVNGVLSRLPDFTSPNQMNYYGSIGVEFGNVNAGTLWFVSNFVIAVGTSDINFLPIVESPNTGGTGNIIFVNAQSGNDSLGNGSSLNPYATITHALSLITTNSSSQLFTLLIQGAFSEAAIAIKPFVSLVGLCQTSASIVVTGGSNEVTLDPSWTADSFANISNIAFISETGLNFNTSTLIDGESSVILSNVSVGNVTWTGRAVANDVLTILDSTTIAGDLSVTDASLSTSETIFQGNATFASTTATRSITWNSQNDNFTGNIAVTETSAQTTTANFNNDKISGTITITGASSTVNVDSVSNPQGGYVYFLSAVATTFQSNPNWVPVTQVTAASYTVLKTDSVLACNRAGAIAITLPASPETGLTFRIKDISGAAGANNITITPAAGNIDGSGTYVINTNYGQVDLVYTGTKWSIF